MTSWGRVTRASRCPRDQAIRRSPSPGVDLLLTGEEDHVARAAGNLLDAHAAEEVNVIGLILAGGVNAKLAVLVAVERGALRVVCGEQGGR